MTESGAFRTGVGGFNKQDVLQYIDAQQTAHAQELQQWQERLTALQREREEEQQGIEKLRQTAIAALGKAKQLATENEQLQKTVEELNTAGLSDRQQSLDVEHTRREEQALRAEVERLRGEVGRLQAQQAAVPLSAVAVPGYLPEARIGEYVQQIARLEKQRQDDETAITGLKRETAELREFYAAEGAAAREQITRLQADYAALVQQNQQLREQAEDTQRLLAASSGLSTAQAEELRGQAALWQQRANAAEQSIGYYTKRHQELEEANTQYTALMGDVGSFVVDVRAMGQQYLDVLTQRFGEGLRELEGLVRMLRQQVTAAEPSMSALQQLLQDSRGEWDRRLEVMGGSLAERAARVTSPTQMSGEADGAKTSFFRPAARD